MATLLGTVPTSVRIDRFYSFRTGGKAEQLRFYYGVAWGCTHLLAVGTVFSVATSPYPDATPGGPGESWRLTAWLVVEGLAQFGKHKGEWERMYRPVSERVLEDAEIEYLMVLVEAHNVHEGQRQDAQSVG